ncbi:MAG: helix-turn-helix transcriptional regulator [bacterium]|nr:helix-turn-helix transcriptional regulator [Candidatus Kapabacteria bacterium]
MFKQQGDYRYLSKGVVQMLVKRGLTLTAIAEMAGVTKSFISRVNAGTRSLTLDHLSKLEKTVGEPLPLLLLKSMSLDMVPKELRPLYRQTLKLIETIQGRPRRKKAAA